MLRRTGLALILSVALPVALLAEEVRGVIVRVDLERKELQVEVRSPEQFGLAMTFHLQNNTPVLFGPDEGTLKDLATGKRIRVEFDPRDNQAKALHLFGFRPPRPEVLPPAQANSTDAVAGVLLRVSYVEREIILLGAGARPTETIIQIPEDVRVVQDGKSIAYDDLSDGRAATVQVTRKQGKLFAQTIQVGEVVVQTVPPAPPGRLARMRRILKLADRVLEMTEHMTRPPDR